MKETGTDWIFYLQLSPKLTQSFFELDHFFKSRGYTLIPVKFSDLMSINLGEGQFHVLTTATTIEEANYFHKKVRKLSHYLLRSKRMHLYFASSFGLLNDTHLFGSTGQYHFVQLPVGMEKFCDTITSTIELKKGQTRKWPGTSRRLGSTIG